MTITRKLPKHIVMLSSIYSDELVVLGDFCFAFCPAIYCIS